jgi:hypothetical protein
MTSSARSRVPLRGLLLAGALLVSGALEGAEACEAFRFAPPRDVMPLPGVLTAHAADVNGDGLADLLAVAGSRVHGAVQRPDGTFTPLAPRDLGAHGLLVADVDGDGTADSVLLADGGPRRLAVSAEGGLEAGPPAVPPVAIATRPVAIADLDGDGREEVLVNAHQTLDAWRMGSDGVFRREVVAPLALGAGSGLSLVAGDFDGDGDDDVVATAENYPSFAPRGPLLWNDGRGALTTGAPVGLPEVWSTAVADFDGDGREEFAWAGVGTTAMSHYWTASLAWWDGVNGLDGKHLDILSSPASLLSADFDRDGRPDLVVSGGYGRLHRGLGRDFGPAVAVSGLSPTAAVDVDGDGYPDLVGRNENGVAIARNVCGSSLPDASVPVVVSTSGANGVRFETELTLDNVSGTAVDLDLTWVPSLGGGAGSTTLRLEAAAQLFFPSVLDALADAGIPVAREGDRAGSLAIRVRGGNPASVTATARVVAVGAGRGGVGFAGRPLGAGLAPTSIVGWLRETGGDRSNLAVVNLGGERDGDVVLRATLVSGETPSRSVVLPEVRLAPGALHQWNRVLAGAGFTSGWVVVTRVSGTAPFFAWGVVNDEGTGDGSFVAGFESDLPRAASLVVPAVVESGRYATDLILTNTRNEAVTLSGRLVSETISAYDRTARFRLEVPAFGQLFLSDFVERLRGEGDAGLPPRGGEVVGALFLDVEEGSPDGFFVGARVRAAKPEGRYGVFYEATPADRPERRTSQVLALRQDASVRTNLAIVNLEDETIDYRITVRDPARGGAAAGEVRTLTVGPRRWVQVASVLEALGTGLQRGSALVESVARPARFLAYGVTNEGARPGEGSDDGTYLPGR